MDSGPAVPDFGLFGLFVVATATSSFILYTMNASIQKLFEGKIVRLSCTPSVQDHC